MLATTQTPHSQDQQHEQGSDIYEPYTLQSIAIAHALRHPAKLVESKALRSCRPPTPSYKPHLPENLIAEGILSDAQLEAIIFAGNAHKDYLKGYYVRENKYTNVLPASENNPEAVRLRRGFMLADSTGVGKGRTGCGIMLDNILKAAKEGKPQKAVWVTLTDALLKDARRDWEALGGSPEHIRLHSKFPQTAPIPLKAGILFTTYATLRSSGSANKLSRVEQIVQWLGEDFDGVILFDECHALQNATATKKGRFTVKPSQQSIAGQQLTNALPNSRVVYMSATGAGNISSLAYASRLGLWGTGDFPFTSVSHFIGELKRGGTAAAEVICRDLKSLGLFFSRSVSLEGVKFEIVDVRLTEEQEQIYNKCALAYQQIQEGMHQALCATNLLDANGNPVSGHYVTGLKQQFESNKLRFFTHLITSFKMPEVIGRIEQDLEQGKAVVCQIVSTNEAILKRRLEGVSKADWHDLNIDIAPIEYILDYIQHVFPVQLHQIQTDGEGREISVPVFDEDGKPVASREALAIRANLISEIQQIDKMPGVLEALLFHFGHDRVAEVTGRKYRLLRDGETDRVYVNERKGNVKDAEVSAFQNGDKDILVFSDCGGTGQSYHADLSCKNQKQRVHYVIDLGHSSFKCVQGLGRTHRSNQRCAPIFVPVFTSVPAEQRLISAIAKKLHTLGALTRGERQAGNQGLFHDTDNVESKYGTSALYHLLHSIVLGDILGCSLEDFERMSGLKITTENGALRSELPTMRQFLNRLLAFTLDIQELLYSELETRLRASIEQAIERGTYDGMGLEQLKGKSFKVLSSHTIYQPSGEGLESATTKAYQIERTRETEVMPLFEALRRNRTHGGTLMINSRSERVGFVVPTSGRIDSNTGKILPCVNIVRPSGSQKMLKSEFERSHWKPVAYTTFSQLWEKEVSELPLFTTDTFYIISGVLLPIWTLLDNTNMKVYRVKITGSNQTILGRYVDPENLQRVYDKLGVQKTAEVSLEDQIKATFERGHPMQVNSNFRLSRSHVRYEKRLELLGQRSYDSVLIAKLRSLGAFCETINWRNRVFIPTDLDQATRVVKAIQDAFPV